MGIGAMYAVGGLGEVLLCGEEDVFHILLGIAIDQREPRALNLISRDSHRLRLARLVAVPGSLGGVCNHEPITCSDGDACTEDPDCDPATGCPIVPVVGELDCDDGDACTIDTCDPELGCQHAPKSCEDENECTLNDCDPATGCLNTPIECDDDNVCNGVEGCNPSTGCTPGTPLQCDDNNICNGVETCDPASGCQPGTPLVCDDNNVCTNDSCHPTAGCQYLPISCDDNDACTIDICNPAIGCVYTNIDCDDEDACTTDSCSPGSGCQYDPLDCDDNDACTTDTCDPASGCQHDPLDCDDNNACTTDTCDPASGCRHDPVDCDDEDACTTDSCNPASGCQHDPVDCDDGNVCNGVETCEPASGCVPGTPLDCNDGNLCTTDSCDPVAACQHLPVDCDDGNACNGLETCDPALGCQSGTPPDCDDGNPCTTDSCIPASGCQHDPVDCDDGNACTTDSCNPATGACVHDPLICDDGDACNGVETCDPASGCVNSVEVVICGPCHECDPATGECVEENHSTTFTQAGILDGTLWWFDGESQQQYSTQVTMEAVDLSDGKFHWIIAPESQPRVDFENGQDEIIKYNINTVELISTGPSQQLNDVIVILIHDDCEEQVSGFPTTVYAPDSMQFQFVTDDPWIVGSFTGYKSSHHYKILDHFGTVLPRSVDVNETFDTAMVSDFPGETWIDESPQGLWVQADPSDWVDIVAAATQAGAIPPAQVPQDPLGNVKVQHNEGTFRVGSQAFGKGVPVKTVTWQFYKDHGRHE